MKRLLMLSILLSTHCMAQTDEDLTLTFDDEIPDFMEPTKPAPKKPKLSLNDDNYCLCKCIKKGGNSLKAKPFKGKLRKQACLCECAA